MGKKVAILQSNYIPWKGYFDIINACDEFIFYDDVQYSKNDWRNRNLIKTQHGIKWLTIPVSIKSLRQLIKDTRISDRNWNIRHWKTLMHSYSKSKKIGEWKDCFEELYLGTQEQYLSEINYRFISEINKFLGTKTKISWSSDYDLIEGKTERLLHLCKQANATCYLSGPAAKGYLDTQMFDNAGIEVEWVDYTGYPEYEQVFPPFEHKVSILDLIFNTGCSAPQFMKSFNKESYGNTLMIE